jgi:hypothetical protein
MTIRSVVQYISIHEAGWFSGCVTSFYSEVPSTTFGQVTRCPDRFSWFSCFYKRLLSYYLETGYEQILSNPYLNTIQDNPPFDLIVFI